MIIDVHEPKFKGQYITADDERLPAWIMGGCFATKPYSGLDATQVVPKKVDYPARYYFVICFKRKNKVWQEVWTAPVTKESGVKNKHDAYHKIMENFKLSKGMYKGISNRWKKYDAIMPRLKVPDSFIDIIQHLDIDEDVEAN